MARHDKEIGLTGEIVPDGIINSRDSLMKMFASLGSHRVMVDFAKLPLHPWINYQFMLIVLAYNPNFSFQSGWIFNRDTIYIRTERLTSTLFPFFSFSFVTLASQNIYLLEIAVSKFSNSHGNNRIKTFKSRK